MNHGDFVIECECGRIWLMDYEPTPQACEGKNWRPGIFQKESGIDWGRWVDDEGRLIDEV